MNAHTTRRAPLGTVDPNMPAVTNKTNAGSKGPSQPAIQRTIRKGNSGVPNQSHLIGRNKNMLRAQAQVEDSSIPKFRKIDTQRLTKDNRRKTTPADNTAPARLSSKAKPHVPAASARVAELSKESRRQTGVTASLSYTPHELNNPGVPKHNRLPARLDPEIINQIGQIRNDITELKAQSSQSVDNEKLTKLMDDVHKLSNELSKSRAINESLAAENSTLRDQLSESPDPQEDIAGKYAELSAQVPKLNSDLQAAITERDDLREQKETLENSCTAQAKTCTERSATIATLESDIDALKSKERELLRQLDKAESSVSSREMELRRLERERDAVTLERDDMCIDLQAKTKNLRSAAEEIRELRAANDELTTEKERMQKDFHVRTGCIQSEAKSRVEVLEKELSSVTITKERLARDGEAMSLQICSLKDAVSELENKAGRMDAELITRDARIEARSAECSKLSAELNETKTQLSDKEAEVASMREQAREDAKQRRKLHNMIQELKGNIRVFCRVRPPARHEVESLGGHSLFEYTDKGQGIVTRPIPREDNRAQPLPFKFDKVFDPSCSQDTVFEEISELVQSALDGYRVCIFAYGQTGSGKTYTMLGQRNSNGDVHLGMIPRAVRQVFDSAKAMEVDGWSFKLSASFLEIYNESVRDLLVDSRKASGKEEYRITYNNDTTMCVVSDLTVVDVQDEHQVQQLIEKSMKNRATAATKANERSSRSHSVFRLMIEGRNSTTGQTLNGLLNLIDLAGSERLNQSKAEGDRLRETKHINKSLSALGDVISALANRDKHVPFRNSRLTYLLQDSLGGDCKTLMFVNVSHAAESLNESVCSLRFAAKVNSCHVGTARRSARIEL